jgi:salicylate hydroxylase
LCIHGSLRGGANTAFEDAYELAECLSNAPDIETALHAYETSRIPRTEVIYDRSANLGRDSYQSDSETTFTKMMNPSQMDRDNFEAWLYSYNPSRLAIPNLC